MLVDHPERLRTASRLADDVLLLLQGADDHRERIRLVVNREDAKAALRDGRLERGLRDKRLQRGARLEDKFTAFIRAEDLECRPALQGKAARLAFDVRDELIVVARIVVGQCHLPNARRRGNLHHVVVRAVPPGFLRRILLGRVLRVVDHEIRIGHEFRVPAIAFVQDRLDAPRLRARAPEFVGERLMIHQVHHCHAVSFDSVAHRHGRVIEKLRRNPNAADRVDAFGQVVVRDRCRQLIQVDGEIGELHLAGQDVMQRTAAAFGAIDCDGVPFDKGRSEERKTLNVIPVRMAEENVRVDGFLALRHQLGGQPARTGAAVENKKIAVGSRQLDARGVAAEVVRARSGSGDRPSGTPETYFHEPAVPFPWHRPKGTSIWCSQTSNESRRQRATRRRQQPVGGTAHRTANGPVLS